MNDRYLYRAKHVHAFDVNKKHDGWVYGFLYCENYIYSPELGTEKLIDPSTICQCTGLKKLFEKDIVKRTDIHKVGEPSIGIVEYDVENTAFVIHWIDKEKYSPMYPWKDKIKVIGNIFDNPELLEVGE
ncbi:YopX family protein [Bariatricus sp. HCP28S3_E4]|uniref:YopX family protein n=1 Tax=unclassified Bariatricus TaxID=2677046 RepID=UPI003F8BD438